jgi:hypothetical protein
MRWTGRGTSSGCNKNARLAALGLRAPIFALWRDRMISRRRARAPFVYQIRGEHENYPIAPWMGSSGEPQCATRNQLAPCLSVREG